jgi:cytochrome bd-type quinol oxidase subunit 1
VGPRGAFLGTHLRHQLCLRRGDRHSHGVRIRHQLGAVLAAFGGVIGQPLAMEGVFSFFLESAFLGLFLYGEKRISKLMHWFSAVMVFVGSWISGSSSL